MKNFKIKLEDVSKKVPKRYRTRGITISHEHASFVDENEINLSLLVRTILDQLIEEKQKENKE